MNKYALYLKAFIKAIKVYNVDKPNKDLVKKIAFYGTKVVKGMPKAVTYENTVDNFQFASAIKEIMGMLTPKEFVNLFPIEKDFKGYKHETKDYFYTRDYINTLEQDKQIGEEITKLLWEYQNWDVSSFAIKLMTLMSYIRRFEGKPSIAEEWARENGLETYKLHTDEKGKQFLMDKQGRTQKVTKPRPKHLKLVR